MLTPSGLFIGSISTLIYTSELILCFTIVFLVLRGTTFIFMKPSINVSIFTVNLILQGVKIRIVQSPRTDAFPSLDTVYLSQKGLADVRSLNITRLVGSGILHTKMWLVDGKHFYVGSANQDWRALTQVWCNLCNQGFWSHLLC